MVRSLISRLSILVVLIAMVTACSKKTEYTHVIPADATAVVAIYVESIAGKTGIDGENKKKLIDALKDGLNFNTFQQVEKIMKDPSESGLSLKDPIYSFTTSGSYSPTLVMKVSDMDKLKASLAVMAKEQISGPLTDGKGYQYATLNGKTVCAFNESAMIITELKNDAEQTLIADLFGQEAGHSINVNPGFERMQKKKGDVLFFASMDALSSLPARQLTRGLSSQIDLKDLMMAGSLSFEKGKIAMQFESYSEDKEIQAILKKQEEATGKINGTFFANFPSSTLAFFTLNVNGGKFYEILQENKDFRENFSLAKAEKTKEIFNSFKGDISVGLINVTMSDAPTFMGYAEAESGMPLEALYAAKADLGLKRGEDIVKLGDNEYVYKSRSMNVFFGFRDKYMYATNDEILYKNIGKSNDKSIKDARYISDMKGKKQFAVIDMEAIIELPVVKLLVSFGGEEVTTYFNMASAVSYLEITGEGEGKANINLWFEDKDTNSLKQIVDFARQFTGL